MEVIYKDMYRYVADGNKLQIIEAANLFLLQQLHASR